MLASMTSQLSSPVLYFQQQLRIFTEDGWFPPGKQLESRMLSQMPSCDPSHRLSGGANARDSEKRCLRAWGVQGPCMGSSDPSSSAAVPCLARGGEPKSYHGQHPRDKRPRPHQLSRPNCQTPGSPVETGAFLQETPRYGRLRDVCARRRAARSFPSFALRLRRAFEFGQ